MRQMISRYLGVIMVLALLTASAYGAATVTQTFNLHPGWNAIYLEVQPEPKDPASVFNGIPLESLWTRNDRTSPAEFVDDPADGLGNIPGWLAFHPAEDPVLNNLFIVRVNKPYLVKIKGVQPVTLNVTGSPKLQAKEWLTDSFNLVGFHLDPAVPVSFEAFMAPSAALKSRIAYRLSDEGRWTIVNNPSQAKMKSGEAYWMYAEGASKYDGPLAVETDGGRLLFSKNVTRRSIKIKNLSGSDKTVTVRISPAFPDKIVYPQFNQSGYPDYYDINSLPPIVLKAGKSSTVTIMMQTQKAPATLETIMTISDAEGVRIQIPLSVEN